MTAQLRDENGVPLPAFRIGTIQKVAYTGTHGAIGNAISENCKLVLVWCSTDAHVKMAATPVATTNDCPVTGKVHFPIAVDKPGTSKISAIQQSAGGTMWVIELL